jgi:hypothetical protein
MGKFDLARNWTFDDALPLIRAVQPVVRRFGYHVCLGGGVLNKGASDHDLDLYFLPMNNKGFNTGEVLKFLEKTWDYQGPIGEGKYPPDIFCRMEHYTYSGLRIDAFFLGEDSTVQEKVKKEKELSKPGGYYTTYVTPGGAATTITNGVPVRGAYIDAVRRDQEQDAIRHRNNIRQEYERIMRGLDERLAQDNRPNPYE